MNRRVNTFLQLCVTAAMGQSPLASAQTGDGILEEITVTARKRTEDLQQTPVSVSAFSSVELERRGARSFADLIAVVPNVSVTDGLQIRGISYNQRNVGIDTGVSVYVDGVFTGRAQTIDQDLTDVARVEVLRGPQGTLFGKNSIAGAVNIVSHLPVHRFEGSALIDVGNLERRRAQAMLNAPLGEGAALRLSGFHSEIGGYVTNLIDGAEYNRSDSYGGKAALLIEPSDQLQLVLRADYFSELARNAYQESSLGQDSQSFAPRKIVAPGANTTVLSIVPAQRRSMKGASATFDYRIADALTFTSISALRESTDTTKEEQDNSALDVIQIDWLDSQQQYTQEFRLAGRIGASTDYVAGLYYFNQKAETQHAGILGVDFAIPIPGGFLVPPGTLKPITPRGSIDTESYAAFVDTTLSITSNLDLLAGLRYTSERKDIDFRVDAVPEAQPLFYVIPRDVDSASNSDLSPTVGVRYRISDELNAYVKFSNGFKSGGWNADFVAAGAAPAPTVQSLYFEPEEASAYEIGLKTEWFDRRLRVNTAVFYTDYTNLQVAQFFGINRDAGGQLAVTGNAGSATIQGAEVELAARPAQHLTLTAGVGYQAAEYDNFDNVDGAGASADGKKFAGVPKLTANASLDYVLPLKSSAALNARIDFSYRDSTYGDVQNTARLTTSGYGLVNGRFGYANPGGRWEASVWVMNLLDREYALTTANDGFAIGQSIDPVTALTYGRPQTFGLELRANF